jgi:Family of unknown function (DUF6155)
LIAGSFGAFALWRLFFLSWGLFLDRIFIFNKAIIWFSYDHKKLREHFQKQEQESLLDEILTLYKTFDAVKEYYDSRLEPTATHDISQRYKKILEEQFCPKKGFPELKYSVARKAISAHISQKNDFTF